MKCITCAQEIPDTSSICPFCNNKVEPIQTAAEAFNSEQTSVLPQVPSDYKLPKDQVTMTTQMNAVSPETVNPTDSVPSAPPAVPQDIPAPPVAPAPSSTMQQNASELGSIAAPPKQTTQTFFDATKVNLDNIDLNANSKAQTIDYTQTSASDKLGSTIDPTKKKPKNKKAKLFILAFTIILLITVAVLGVLFYLKEYQSTDKRIDAVVDGIFKPLTAINKSKIETGSGSYKLSYTSSKNDDSFVINVNGKYAYNLPTKKVDVIANFTSINNNQELLDKELNVELYLENNRAYFLMQNFKEEYIYTDIDNSYNVIKDIETRFDNPEELLLFKLLNQVYDNGLNELSADYHKYLTNISQNDINYQNIIRGIRESIKEALKVAPSSQSIENGNNVIKINVRNPDTFKVMNKTFVNTLKNNKNAWQEISKLIGDDTAFYDKLMKMAEEIEYQGINSDIIIATDMFKEKLKYIIIPSVKDGKICTTTITAVGSGYRIVSKIDGREIININYSKSSSKTSTTENKTYKISGIIYQDNVANNINIELELIEDINPEKITVITKNSVDYQNITPEERQALVDKIQEFGNLGVLFKSHYKGLTPTVEEPVVEPTNGEE